jgi:alkanesulfonate monooxygenase SsuD/methylene tetrahydromethanopterin reductase-like flavin-dependent oxidoreductase (luciferase family)
MAKMAASIQVLSEGHFTLGYGAGWHEGEHKAFGFDYPSPGERVDRLEEAVQVIRALWTESPASFSGRFYSIDGAHAVPLPDPTPKIMIGGGGEKKTLRVVAQYADWWNDVSRPLPELKHKLEVLRAHCDDVGRDYDSIRKTLSIPTFIDRTHSRAVERANASGRAGQTAVAGDPSAVREQYEELREMGFDLFVTFFENFQDLSEMKLFMDEVIPAFA